MNNKQFLKKAYTAALVAVMVCSSSALFAQVKIGDNPTAINPGSVIELESTNKGLLMPRISLTNTTTWGLAGTAAAGMHVFNTNTAITSTNAVYPILATKIGEYYWDGTGWVAIQAAKTFFGFGTTTVSGTQAVPINATTKILFTGEDWDSGNVFNPTTGTFTVAEAGQYLITGSVITGNNPTTGGMNLICFKNNAVFFTGGNFSNFLPSSPFGLVVSHIANLAVGDVIDFRLTLYGTSTSIGYGNFSAAKLN